MNKKIYEDIGRRVKLLRWKSGITQTYLAEVLGISQTHMSNLEAGRSAFSVLHLYELREIFGCHMMEFFADDYKEPGKPIGNDSDLSSEDLSKLVQIIKIMKS